MLDELHSGNVAVRVLFLEADEQTLLTRYKETRRRHPLARNGNVADGVHREQELLDPIRERADTIIDTTGLSASALRRKVASEMLAPGEPGRLAVTFCSFGHKHGPGARRRHRARRPLPAQPALGARPARAHGFDRRGGRVRRPRRPAERVLRQDAAAARVPAAPVRRRGQVAPRRRHRLHGRPPPLRDIAEALAAHFRDDERYFVEAQHRDVERAPVARASDASRIAFPAPLRLLQERVRIAMPVRVGINGFGRIGRNVFRAAHARAPTSRSSPSTTSPTPRRSRTCSSTTRSTGRSRAP